MLKKSTLAKVHTGTSQTIIDGAISVMAETGLRNLTTKRVSERASVSTASIHYFFETKERLITESFAHVMNLMWDRLSEVGETDELPLKKIEQTLYVFFNEDINELETIRIWPQLWHHAGQNADTEQQFQAYNKGVIALFENYLMSAGMTAEKAKIYAYRLNALHRGLWIEFKVGGVLSDREIRSVIASVLESIQFELNGGSQ